MLRLIPNNRASLWCFGDHSRSLEPKKLLFYYIVPGATTQMHNGLGSDDLTCTILSVQSKCVHTLCPDRFYYFDDTESTTVSGQACAHGCNMQ